jgi:type II secretion system protein L
MADGKENQSKGNPGTSIMAITPAPVLLFPRADGLWYWRGGQTDLAPWPEDQEPPKQATVALPADRVRLSVQAVSSAERKHLQRVVPFMIEEGLITDLADSHIAYRLLSDETCAVAVVGRSELEHCLACLPEPANTWPWTSEALLLPWQPGECVVLFEGNDILVRDGEAMGFRLPVEHAATVLPSMVTADAYVVYGTDAARQQALLPPTWQDKMQWRHGGWAAILLLSEVHKPPIDLRQGDYAPRLPIEKWWRKARAPLALGTAALTLSMVASGLEVWRLKGENLRLRETIQSAYRQVNPKGAVVDVEKQLDRQLAEFNVDSNAKPLLPSLARVQQRIAAIEGMSVVAMNYQAQQKQLRLTLTALSFAQVDALRTALTDIGMTVELEGSNAQGNDVRARLTVGF